MVAPQCGEMIGHRMAPRMRLWWRRLKVVVRQRWEAPACFQKRGSFAQSASVPVPIEDRRHERAQVLHAIGSGTNDDDTERERRDLLLEFNTAVHCDQNIIVAPHAAQEFPVLDTGPTAADHCLDSMPAELR
jgi:hypothetical protein